MRVGTLYAVLRLETGAFDAALASSETKMSRFFGLVRAGAVIAASAVAGIAVGSVVAAATFDKHMTEALAIMDGVTDEIRKDLEDAARAVAKTTTFSANEAADAYYFLAAAGFTAAESIKLLPVVAQFAQASLIGMEESTNRLAGIMTAFGMRTGDATQDMIEMTRASDVLVRGATLSLATMEELATALVTGTAQAFRLVGKDIEEATAVLMVFADQGIVGATAGTALSIVMRELQTKAIKNADAFAQFGIEVFDASGEMRNMADIIADFERAMAGMTDEQKKAFLLTLGLTDRSNKFLLSLIGTSEAIREYEEQLRSASGYTDKVAQKQLEAFTAQLTIMWHKIVDVGITIGKVLLPHLTEIVKAVGNWFDENNALIGQITEKLVEAIRILVLWLENHLFRWLKRIWGIIGDVAHQIHMWIVQLDSLSGSFDPVERALSAFTMGLNKILDWAESDKGTIALALGAIAFGIRALSAALMANPIVALLTAIVVAIGLLQQAWNLNVGGIQEKWADFVKWFETNALPRIQDALEWIEINVAPILEAAFKWFFEEAVPALMDGIKWLFEVGFPALGEAIADFYEQNREPLERLFTWLTDEAIPDVIEGLEGFGNWLITNGPTILSILGQLLEVLGGLFTIMLNIASYVIPILWEGLMTILAPLGIVGEAVGFLLFIIDESFKEIRRVVETVIGAVSEILTGLEGLIREIVAEIESRIDIVIGAWEELGRIWEDVWTGIQDWAETAGEIVEGIIDDIANAIYGVVRAVERAIDIIEDFLVAKGKYDTLAGKVPSPTAPKPSPTPTSSGTVSPTVSGTMIGGVQKFALGVRDFGGGLALVGERGPELVWLPPHASVYPNGEGPSTGLTVNLGGITVNAGNDVSPGAARKFAEMIHDELATTLQEQSARFPNKPRVGLT